MDTKTLDIDRLRKVVALYGSPNQGEKLAAINRTESLLKAHGKTFLDLLDVNSHGGNPQAIADLNQLALSLRTKLASAWGDIQHAQSMREHAEQMREHADRMREHAEKNAGKVHPAEKELAARQKAQDDRERVWRDQQAREQRQTRDRAAKEQQAEADAKKQEDENRIKREEPERRAVIKRYGGGKAVLALGDREIVLRKAVKKWSKFRDWPNQDKIKEIDGVSDFDAHAATKRVIKAISTAYPLPPTIAEAHLEHAYWERRAREIAVVTKVDWDAPVLDGPSAIRLGIVRDLLYSGIRARNVSEVLTRHQLLADLYSEENWDDIVDISNGVFQDLEALEALSAAPKTETVVSHDEFRAAREKREKPPVKRPKQSPLAQTAFEF